MEDIGGEGEQRWDGWVKCWEADGEAEDGILVWSYSLSACWP